jgi:hypothetical protein
MTPPARKPVGQSFEAESIGELSRMLAAFKNDTHDDLIAINARLDQLSFVTPEVYAADRMADSERHNGDIARIERIDKDLAGKCSTSDLKVLSDDVKVIKSNTQWLWRTLGSALIVAIVGIVIAASGFAH